MNFIRSRLSLGSFLGQRRQVTQIWSHRGMCKKLQEPKEAPPPAKPAQEPRYIPKINEFRPSDKMKKILVWSGRYKSIDQVPETVTYGMVEAALSRIRIKVAYIMMAGTIVGCFVMIFMGKRALAREETLTNLNLKRKARLREELKEKEAAAALSDKSQ